jgi:hypothetical protein
MNFDNLGNGIFFLIIALFFGSLVFKAIKYGGFKAAMFGAPIETTLGEVRGSSVKIINIVLKVHKLGGNLKKQLVLR